MTEVSVHSISAGETNDETDDGLDDGTADETAAENADETAGVSKKLLAAVELGDGSVRRMKRVRRLVRVIAIRTLEKFVS